MKLRYVLLLAAVLTYWSEMDVAAAEPARSLTGYAVTAWTDAEGLPFGAVYAIVQDRDGYLWIGTNAGLLRFDGARFTHWEAIGDGPLPNSPVTALCLARDNSLWVGLANGAGLYRVQHRHADRQDVEPHLNDSITAIAEDHSKTMWIVAGSALHRLHGSTWSRVAVSGTPHSPRVVNVYVRTAGEVLVGTNEGLFQYVSDTDHFRQIAPGWVWAVSEDTAGALWTTDTVAGFRRIGEVRRPPQGFERNGYRLKHDQYGNLWLATIGEGLWRVDPETGGELLIEKATLQAGLFSDSVQSLFEDREGNLWVGTTVGLHRLTRQRLTPVGNVGLVVTAEATSDGDLWVGTNYGLSRFSLTAGRWRSLRTEGRNFYVRTLHRDRAGTLWVGTNDGLMHVVNSRLSGVALPPELDRTPITCITTNSRGELWLGDGKRLFQWDGTHLVPLQSDGQPDVGIAFAHHDASDRLWIAFWDGTVGTVDPSGRFQRFAKRLFGRDTTSVFAMLEDGPGQAMWFATNNGVSRLKAGRVTTVTAAQGLPGNQVWALSRDKQGYIWASVDLGVVRFTAQEFDASTSVTGHRLRYELYDPSDGLAGAPILNVRSGSFNNGRLWFVRGGALTIADPESLSNLPSVTPGPLRIEGMRSEEKRFAAEAGVLPPGTKRIEINYTTVALTHPNRIRFRYRLDGFDTQWIEAITRRSASYTNLPPRNYVFRLEAETEDGTWHGGSVDWAFAIRPMFYQTWSFYTACLLALCAMIWTAWRFRVRLDRDRYAMVLSERTRLSREIHDTLLQSMVGVTLQLDDLANDGEGVSASARLKLVNMRRRVASYIREARRSILDLRSPLLETKDLPGALREVVGRAIGAAPVRFAVTISGQPRRCSARVENEVLRIANEAVTNSIRHAQASRIDILLRFGETNVTLEIADDGCGLIARATHERDTHYGIISMQERAESLGGQLTIEGVAHGGTRVTADLPDPVGDRLH